MIEGLTIMGQLINTEGAKHQISMKGHADESHSLGKYAAARAPVTLTRATLRRFGMATRCMALRTGWVRESRGGSRAGSLYATPPAPPLLPPPGFER